MRAGVGVMDYCKAMASEAGMPDQSLIGSSPRDCLAQNRRIQIKWPCPAWCVPVHGLLLRSVT